MTPNNYMIKGKSYKALTCNILSFKWTEKKVRIIKKLVLKSKQDVSSWKTIFKNWLTILKPCSKFPTSSVNGNGAAWCSP